LSAQAINNRGAARAPLSDATATPLAAGYAKSGTNYTTEISIPKSIEHPLFPGILSVRVWVTG